ncbi:hypothetical protein V8C86DRAFT_84994 [Haematococcus lacustris]
MQASDPAPSSECNLVKHYFVAVTPATQAETLVELLTALQLHRRRLSTCICVSCRSSLDEVVSHLLAANSFALAVLHSDLTAQEQLFQAVSFKLARPESSTQEAAAAAAAAGHPGQPNRQGPQPLHPGGGPSSSSGSGRAPVASAKPGSAVREADELDDPASYESQLLAQLQAEANQPADYAVHDACGAMRLMNMRPGCSLVLVTSDACLAAVPHKLLPLGASLLIHYDLPHKKEVMTHRLAATFATQPVPNNARAGGVGGAGQSLPPRAASLLDGAEGGAQIVVSFVVAGRVPEFRAVERFAAPLEIQQMPVHVADIFD